MKKLSTIQILALLGAAWISIVMPVQAQNPAHNTSSDPAPVTDQGSQHATEPFWTQHGRLTFGYQLGFGLENNIPHNVSHINFIFVAPQIGFIAWDSPHSRLPLKRFEFISQQMLGASPHPGGSIFGTSLVMRFGLTPIGRVLPYFDAGSGPVHTTIDNNATEITGHTQFLSQGGAGIQYFIRPQRALVLEYHYFHMSNAGLQEPNHGFNGSMVTVGFRWLRRPRPSAVGSLQRGKSHLPHFW
ncbi:MAG TPA: acyloxyacyl hydrolase [Terriglobia bacterium]|nr:acyloxyacyl hydrolase [Terriglobia bacterium]